MSTKVTQMEQVKKGTFQLQTCRVYWHSATNCHLSCKFQFVNLLWSTCVQFLQCLSSKFKRESLTTARFPQLCLSMTQSLWLSYSVNMKTKESFWSSMLQKPLYCSPYASTSQLESTQEWSLPWWWHRTHWWYSQLLLECWSVWSQGNSWWLMFCWTT